MKKIIPLLMILLSHFVFAQDFNYKESEIKTRMNSKEFLSLLETLPLMEEVYKMTINYGDKSIDLQDDRLGENWGEYNFYFNSDSQLSLHFRGSDYEELHELSFSGTAMESNQLEMWLAWEGIDELKELISYFASLHNLNIKATEVPRPDAKLHSVVKARGKVPDVVMIQSSAVEKLVSARAIQSLNYMDHTNFSNGGIEAFTLNNKLWAIPFYYDTQVIYYNKDLIKQAPTKNWTLSEMENLARTITSPDIYPMAWNVYSSNWLIPFQMSFGKESLIDSDGHITLDDAPTKEALNYVLSLIDSGLLSPMERDAMDALFILGKVGFIMSGSYSIPYFESLGLNFGILPLPLNDKTQRSLSPLEDYKAFTISKKTKHPLLAKRLIEFLTSPNIQKNFSESSSKLSARKTDQNYAKWYKEGTIIPPQQIYKVYKNNMWKLLRFAISGQLTVEQTLQKGQNLMNAVQ